MNGDLLESIHHTEREIEGVKDDIKKTEEAITAEVESLNVFKELQEARDRVKMLSQQLKSEAESDPQVTKLMEEVGDLKFKLKDLKDILSGHLIRYYHETEDTQVPRSDRRRANQLIMSARLGKESAYQERLDFNGK